MSDSPVTSVLTEVEQAAASAIPFTGIISTALDIVKGVESVVVPQIASAEKDKPLNENKARLAQFESIMDNPNEGARGQQLGNFTNQLLLNANIPIGLISGRTISVPLEHFTALIDAVGQLIETRELESAAQTTPAK